MAHKCVQPAEILALRKEGKTEELARLAKEIDETQCTYCRRSLILGASQDIPSETTKTPATQQTIPTPTGAIEDDTFSLRISNLLKNVNITTWEQLTNYTEDKMSKFRALGRGGLKEIKRRLAERGLSLKQ